MGYADALEQNQQADQACACAASFLKRMGIRPRPGTSQRAELVQWLQAAGTMPCGAWRAIGSS
jgi:hypothetical protein